MKKIISFIVTLLVLLNTVYIPVFASPVLSEDTIAYPDSAVVLYENNFESGDVGTMPSHRII